MGLVALLVVGPERLPKLAYTAGKWLGKGRAMIGSIKTEIDREMKTEELKRIVEEQKKLMDPLEEIMEETEGAMKEFDEFDGFNEFDEFKEQTDAETDSEQQKDRELDDDSDPSRSESAK